MPSMIQERTQSNGRTGFVYDISGDDITELVMTMTSNADVPFQFIGMIQNVKKALDRPEFVLMTLQNSGVVAGSAQYGGQAMTIQFVSPTQMTIIPQDGQKMTADMFCGADGFGFDDDEDDFDPFGSEFPVPDPRARSRELADRYGDPEEDDDDYHTVAPSQQTADTVKVSDWLLTIVLLAIPVVNIIVLILWLASKKTNQSKKNFLKVQLVLTLIGLLFAGLIGATFIMSGLAGALASGEATIAIVDTASLNAPAGDTQNEEDNNSGESGNEDGFNYDDFSAAAENTEDAEGNENAGEAGNAENAVSGGSMGEAMSENTTPEMGQLAQSNTGVLVIDSVSRITAPDNRSAAVIAMTLRNTTPVEATPRALLEIVAHQGQNTLSATFDPMEGFAPATFDMPIAPEQTGTFQICYYLADDQDLAIQAYAIDGHQLLLEASQPLH